MKKLLALAAAITLLCTAWGLRCNAPSPPPPPYFGFLSASQ